jgi:hypothetical protein
MEQEKQEYIQDPLFERRLIFEGMTPEMLADFIHDSEERLGEFTAEIRQDQKLALEVYLEGYGK